MLTVTFPAVVEIGKSAGGRHHHVEDAPRLLAALDLRLVAVDELEAHQVRDHVPQSQPKATVADIQAEIDHALAIGREEVEGDQDLHAIIIAIGQSPPHKDLAHSRPDVEKPADTLRGRDLHQSLSARSMSEQEDETSPGRRLLFLVMK